jgi:flagellar hook assembly protein FlgD
VKQGTNQLVVDPRTQFVTDNQYSYYQPLVAPFDPFSNNPAVISYTNPVAARVTIALSSSLPMYSNCNPPQFCILQNEFQGSGPHTVRWAGTDPSGRYRPDITKVVVVRYRDEFPRTATVLSGTKPSISGLQVTPTPIFRPVDGATRTVSFTLSTFNNMSVSYKVEFLNQDSVSVLRTISVASGPPGAKSVVWDGKADNGMFVAQGYYTITVTATDAINNVVTSQILTNVQY